MDSLDLEVLRAAQQWCSAGRRALLATVVRTWGSAPRPVGATMVIRDDALVVGSVSGGCIEQDLVEHGRALLDAGDTPALRRYGVSRDDAARYGLPCGGSLELVLQPLTAPAWLDPLLAALDRGELWRKSLHLTRGVVRLAPAQADDPELVLDGAWLHTLHGPRWRLLLIGAGQLSRCLAEMAGALGYQLHVCDPRAEYADSWPLATVPLTRDYPDDFVLALAPDARTAVVALTHDPKLDDAALMEALRSPAFYVGALGSQRNNAARRDRLAQLELAPSQIARLHGPVGIYIGSRTPAEIAVSILAELTAVRHGVVPAQRPGAAAAAGDGCTA